MKAFASFPLQCNVTNVAIPKCMVHEIVDYGLFESASFSRKIWQDVYVLVNTVEKENKIEAYLCTLPRSSNSATLIGGSNNIA